MNSPPCYTLVRENPLRTQQRLAAAIPYGGRMLDAQNQFSMCHPKWHIAKSAGLKLSVPTNTTANTKGRGKGIVPIALLYPKSSKQDSNKENVREPPSHIFREGGHGRSHYLNRKQNTPEPLVKINHSIQHPQNDPSIVQFLDMSENIHTSPPNPNYN